MFIRAMPEVSEIKHSGMEPCAVGSIVEVQVSFTNAHPAKAELEIVKRRSYRHKNIRLLHNSKKNIVQEIDTQYRIV